MAVNVCLPLFGNAGHELEEGTKVSGQQLRTLADELQERLRKAADILDKLIGAGWTAETALYDVLLRHDQVQTRADAEQRLRELGIDLGELMIFEEMEEEEPDY
jgi:hypothetical protein